MSLEQAEHARNRSQHRNAFPLDCFDQARRGEFSADHFKKATSQLPRYLARTPDIVNAHVEGTSWSALGELAVD